MAIWVTKNKTTINHNFSIHTVHQFHVLTSAPSLLLKLMYDFWTFATAELQKLAYISESLGEKLVNYVHKKDTEEVVRKLF